MSTPIVLPQVTVQSDFGTVFNDVEQGNVTAEDIWVSCYKRNEKSVHGKVKISRHAAGEVEAIARDGITWKQTGTSTYSIACPSLSIQPTTIRAPRQVIGELSKAPVQISAFDVAPDLSLCATGDPNGSMILHHISETIQPSIASPHRGAILSLRFFPSSKVILTSSSDLTLAIISTTDLAVHRRLKSRHSAGITDTAIISKGRNILSCSRDGTVRLWDVGGGEQISVMGVNDYSPITKMAVGEMGQEWKFVPPDGEERYHSSILDPREVETHDKLVFCALKSGAFTVLDLSSKTTVGQNQPKIRGGKALHSICYSPQQSLLATGSLDGIISVYDTRHLPTPLFSFQRNEACIEDLAFTDSGPHLLVATEDGLPFRVSIAPEGPEIVEELVGYEAGDAVRGIRYMGQSVWTAGDDGVVRRY